MTDYKDICPSCGSDLSSYPAWVSQEHKANCCMKPRKADIATDSK